MGFVDSSVGKSPFTGEPGPFVYRLDPRGPSDQPDTGLARIGPMILTPDWRQYQIDLSETDLSHIAGGFGWSAGYANTPERLTFYRDEIAFSR